MQGAKGCNHSMWLRREMRRQPSWPHVALGRLLACMRAASLPGNTCGMLGTRAGLCGHGVPWQGMTGSLTPTAAPGKLLNPTAPGRHCAWLSRAPSRAPPPAQMRYNQMGFMMGPYGSNHGAARQCWACCRPWTKFRIHASCNGQPAHYLHELVGQVISVHLQAGKSVATGFRHFRSCICGLGRQLHACMTCHIPSGVRPAIGYPPHAGCAMAAMPCGMPCHCARHAMPWHAMPRPTPTAAHPNNFRRLADNLPPHVQEQTAQGCAESSAGPALLHAIPPWAVHCRAPDLPRRIAPGSSSQCSRCPPAGQEMKYCTSNCHAHCAMPS